MNLSDRFLAIMSGTTENGNDMRTVAECARLNGLIPEKDFPMGGIDFESYHDKSLITDAMKAKGKEFLKYINIMWEWSFSDSLAGFHEEAQVMQVLSETPLQMAIPTPATHATTLFRYDPSVKWFKVFDSYEPFYFENSADVWNPQIGMRVALSKKIVLTPTPVDDSYLFNQLLKYGSTGEDVVQLQRLLIKQGFLKVGLDTGKFLKLTEQAVKNFQMKYGLVPDGIVGAKTNYVLNNL